MMLRRLLAASVVAGFTVLSAVSPSMATQWDGEERGEPMSLLQVLGLFVGIPGLIIATVYFLVMVPPRKDEPGTDVAVR